MADCEALNRVRACLTGRNLGEAIQAMENFLAAYPQMDLSVSDRLLAIRTDYQMMADYWRRGFKDPQLPSLYDTLLRRMYTLYARASAGYAITHSFFLGGLYQQVNGPARDWTPQAIKEMLESFVSEVAMLALEPEHVAEERRKACYARHHQEMKALFYYILTSGPWTDGMGQAMEDILLSPTVDANDQQLLISSVMLSAMGIYDMAKFRTLIHVYQQTAEEAVRQRALVGWVFSLDGELGRTVFPEEVRLVEQLLEDEQTCKELTELQKQTVYCLNAEKDHATLQSEIMPDLLKHQGFRITRNGIEEQEEDPLHDILHPDEDEQNLERVEASFQKMMDMQKQGSDIYFGGFSQMKRFPFFNELTNWLVPFYIDHPDISEAVSKVGQNRFLQSIMMKGPFCNSDKYSFVLAFEQVIRQIPQSMREMMERGEASIEEMTGEERRSATYVRRTYLQDLYRFFRICQRRTEFRDIFSRETQDYLFFANPIFSKTHLERYFNEVAAFLIKKKRTDDAAYLLTNYGTYRQDFQYFMMAGYLIQNGYAIPGGTDSGTWSLKDCYEQALRLQPGQERALVGYARALFAEGDYQGALDTYSQLLAQQPEKRNYLLNKAVCLTKVGQYGEALQLLYRLNYEDEADVATNRVLAWTLTCDGKYEQAQKIYGWLLSLEEPSPEDLLNDGYCLWFSGDIDGAADCFHRYLTETEKPAVTIMENEHELIQAKGITEPEMQMMLYIL